MPDLPPAAPDSTHEYHRAFQVKVHLVGPKTIVELDATTTVAITGSIDPEPDQPLHTCRAATTLKPGFSTLPPPVVYFVDLDHARRAVGTGDELWTPPVPTEETVCRFQLVRADTTVPIPSGAPALLVNLDHVIHLAASWYEMQQETRR